MESGECLHTLLGHTAEIVSLNFDTNGERIMTGSFDHTVKGKRGGSVVGGRSILCSVRVWYFRRKSCVVTCTFFRG